ncbi:MAG TPA: SCO family protein [Candidatus Polarisedimenticolia bacterium]|nr:SCO family protein [Candidatus Polarisedimenticolia bacterium]
MRARASWRAGRRAVTTAVLGLVLAMLVWPGSTIAHRSTEGERLPRIGAAPDFALTTQDGARLSLRELRGKVAVVTFVYVSCTDTCPILTAKLASLQAPLGPELGSAVVFVAITVDPERDTPEQLREYAARHGVRSPGWTFLTGTPAEIADVARRYGVYARRTPGGDVDHTFLTSIVDRAGVLRVQYMGVRFDASEFLADLRSALGEDRRQ